MQPYNSKPIDVNQMQQPEPAVQPVASQDMAENQKKGNGKGTILLILILLLIIGIAVYILFAKNQLKYMQKTSTENSTTALPSYAPSPAATGSASQDSLNVDSPETDLQGIERDIQSL